MVSIALEINVAVHEESSFVVMSILQDLTLTSDIGELEGCIEEYLFKGHKKIALLFTPESALYSNGIAVLIKCMENVVEHQGVLVIIAPNEEIRTTLAMVDVDKIIRIVDFLETLSTIT